MVISENVVNKIGWPRTTGTYQLDLAVPDGTASGMAALQITAPLLAGREVRIPIQ